MSAAERVRARSLAIVCGDREFAAGRLVEQIPKTTETELPHETCRPNR